MQYLRSLLFIGLGGFLGAVARYSLSELIQRLTPGPMPWGTVTVNVLGSLLLGFLVELAELHLPLSDGARLFLFAGVLGAFTTFSTFSHDSVELLRDGHTLAFIGNIGLSVGLALGAVALGIRLAQLI